MLELGLTGRVFAIVDVNVGCVRVKVKNELRADRYLCEGLGLLTH